MTSRQSIRRALPTTMCGEARSGRRRRIARTPAKARRWLGGRSTTVRPRRCGQGIPRPRCRRTGGRRVWIAGSRRRATFRADRREVYKDFEFQLAEFAVGEDQEVAAAAGGIEETELGQLVVKFLQPRVRRVDRSALMVSNSARSSSRNRERMSLRMFFSAV